MALYIFNYWTLHSQLLATEIQPGELGEISGLFMLFTPYSEVIVLIGVV